MSDFNAKHIIEALRSGVPSRTVGEYFSEARPGMMKKITDRMDKVLETGRSDGMIFTGRYGEGKTHLLNTVFNRASAANIVVSMISIGMAAAAFPVSWALCAVPSHFRLRWQTESPGFIMGLQTRAIMIPR